ncbi:MAG: hypothetical protein QW292_14080 [Candidatus Parvarchaeota archaeon]
MISKEYAKKKGKQNGGKGDELMVILAQHNPLSGGKIYVQEPIKKNVINKVPVAVIEVTLTIDIESGHMQVEQNEYKVGYRIEDIQCSLRFNQIPISHTFETLGPISPFMSKELGLIFRISLEDLEEIELKRVDDLELSLHLVGKVIPYNLNNTNQDVGNPEWMQMEIPWKFSQKEWIEFLSNIGYAEKWIVEVDRPKLEGFHEVIEHLEKAEKDLYEKQNPEDVVSDLRAANDSFKTYYNDNIKRMNKLIDEGSAGESDQLSKSERIVEIYKNISYLLNIGPHNDKYRVTYQDALLAYRQFLTILSYYAPYLEEVRRNKEMSKT